MLIKITNVGKASYPKRISEYIAKNIVKKNIVKERKISNFIYSV